MKTISVIGSGYVGVTTAAVAANSGFKVHLIDINKERINVLKSGRSFFYEEGIDALIKHGIDSGTLLPSTDYRKGVPDSDLVFSCVGTPDNPDGSSNLEYVFAAAKTASPLMKKGAVYAQKSTVPVGTGKKVIKLLPKSVSYVSNPEFLREGTAVYDTLYFDRIVAGGSNIDAVDSIIDMYKTIEAHRDSTAKRAGIGSVADQGQYIRTNLQSAELIKVTANAFLSLKISFANSIAKLADHAGADVKDVMDAVGADKRIGRAFLDAGRGYGGGCFPKDISGLISSSTEHGVDLSIMVAADDVNDSMPGYIANKAQEQLGGSLKDKKVALLGLAFKPGTSDARRSPGVKLANILDKAGASVIAYDPHANGEAKEDLRKSVTVAKTLQEAIKKSEAVFIATDWDEFHELEPKEFVRSMSGTLFVDAVNSFDISKIEDAGLQYIGVGRGN